MEPTRRPVRKPYLSYMLFCVLCAVGGFFLGFYTFRRSENLWQSALFILILLSAAYLQIILHESGHLLGGLLTGYRFCSFRVGDRMWIRKQGRLRLRRLFLAGTGGQCLLAPPESKDGRFPFTLYLLGGSFMNLATALLFSGLALVFCDSVWISVLCVDMAFFGVLFALLNGIPLHLALVNNDGYNVLVLRKHPEARRALWLQLKIGELTAQDMRLQDMPAAWFDMPEPDAMKNSLVATIGVFACNRLMDRQEFSQADQAMKRLLEADTGMVGLHRQLLITDRLYCELVGENRPDQLQLFGDKTQQKFMKAMKTFPSVIRTQYAYALLASRDTRNAAYWKQQFEKVAAAYPYDGDIASERALMVYAEQRASVV